MNEKTDLFELDEDRGYSHPKGYFQPGVLALDPHGQVLYRWRGRPTRKNMGGATERPTAEHVFSNVTKALEALKSSDAPVDAELDTNPELDSRGIPWPIFVSILTANGWFMAPKPFPYVEGGPSAPRRVIGAALRIPFFIAAWIAAFVLNPVVATIALAGYAAWITPRIRYINEQFQNLPGTD